MDKLDISEESAYILREFAEKMISVNAVLEDAAAMLFKQADLHQQDLGILSFWIEKLNHEINVYLCRSTQSLSHLSQKMIDTADAIESFLSSTRVNEKGHLGKSEQLQMKRVTPLSVAASANEELEAILYVLNEPAHPAYAFLKKHGDEIFLSDLLASVMSGERSDDKLLHEIGRRINMVNAARNEGYSNFSDSFIFQEAVQMDMQMLYASSEGDLRKLHEVHDALTEFSDSEGFFSELFIALFEQLIRESSANSGLGKLFPKSYAVVLDLLSSDKQISIGQKHI